MSGQMERLLEWVTDPRSDRIQVPISAIAAGAFVVYVISRIVG